MAKRAKSLGINAKSEEELREELLKVLEKNGIDGMEEEETITLMEIAESFVEEPETTDEDDDEVEEVEETEDEENVNCGNCPWRHHVVAHGRHGKGRRLHLDIPHQW